MNHVTLNTGNGGNDKLYLADNFIVITYAPNLWFRFWQKILLGWKWEICKKKIFKMELDKL